jgi:D-alanyl-D-alanine carboxypeptidase (penicillin-binding protein 5/6)
MEGITSLCCADARGFFSAALCAVLASFRRTNYCQAWEKAGLARTKYLPLIFQPMKLLRRWTLCLCVFVLATSAFAQTFQSEAIRPTGVPTPLAKEETASPKSKEPDAATTPKPKRARSKPKRIPSTPREEPLPPRPGGGVPATGAKSVMMVDARTGQTLYEKNADEIRQAASTQKLLTALIIAEHGNLDQPVRVESIDTMAEPVKLNIKPGDVYQRIDLLRALLVKSPNDVARCLARDHAGSVEAFAELMNERARELGATHSHFVNPNGLPVPGQYSSARDLSLIARAAYANPTIRSIVCLPKLVFRYANGRTRELENTNKVLKQLSYCNGMKTGYTEAAGHCLIASGSRPGRDVIVVVLGDSKSGVWRDASALLSWGLWM